MYGHGFRTQKPLILFCLKKIKSKPAEALRMRFTIGVHGVREQGGPAGQREQHAGPPRGPPGEKPLATCSPAAP